MPVKRTPDPLGLLPDHIDVQLDGAAEADNLSEWQAFNEMVVNASFYGRIKRLRRHPQLKSMVADLDALMAQKYPCRSDTPAGYEIRAKIAEAELAAMYFDAEKLPARARSETARKAAKAMRVKNKKQAAIQEAKDKAHSFWLERRAGKHKKLKLRRNVDFATECKRRWPVLEPSTIERKWIPQWEKKLRTHRAS